LLVRAVHDAAEHVQEHHHEEQRGAGGVHVADQPAPLHVAHDVLHRVEGSGRARVVVHGEEDAGDDLVDQHQDRQRTEVVPEIEVLRRVVLGHVRAIHRHHARRAFVHPAADVADYVAHATALFVFTQLCTARGADPPSMYSATAPLPPTVDEFLFAGFLRREPVSLTKAITCDLEVPAEADFVIEGYIDPAEPLVMEGPFGDHTGFYSLADLYPQVHVTAITMRNAPIFPATIVGRPPMEDFYLGHATERI